ncbi:MAG: hypothetical protein ABSA26_16355, partial [Thermoguttaceae bacterium]
MDGKTVHDDDAGSRTSARKSKHSTPERKPPERRGPEHKPPERKAPGSKKPVRRTVDGRTVHDDDAGNRTSGSKWPAH